MLGLLKLILDFRGVDKGMIITVLNAFLYVGCVYRYFQPIEPSHSWHGLPLEVTHRIVSQQILIDDSMQTLVREVNNALPSLFHKITSQEKRSIYASSSCGLLSINY